MGAGKPQDPVGWLLPAVARNQWCVARKQHERRSPAARRGAARGARVPLHRWLLWL